MKNYDLFSQLITSQISSPKTSFDEQIILNLIHNRSYSVFLEIYISSLHKYECDSKLVKFLILCTSCKSEIVRDTAVQKIGEAKVLRNEVIKSLGITLDDKSWVVRCSSMYSLAQQQDYKSSENIILKYNSWSFIEKKWVLIALTMMRDPKSSGFLEKTFRFAIKVDRKYLAAGALAALGFEKYALYLKCELELQKDPDYLHTLNLIFEMFSEIGVSEPTSQPSEPHKPTISLGHAKL